MQKLDNVMSHWDHLIENFETSPKDFYAALEAAIERRLIPDKAALRIEFKEGGLMSAKREYLRVMRGKHAFDICAAPFGTGFFFSWWLIERPSQWLAYFFGILLVVLFIMYIGFQAGFFAGFFTCMFLIPAAIAGIGALVHEAGGSAEDAILAMPLISGIYARVFDPPTYYKIDSALMFQQTVHNAVLEVIDQITSSKGIRLSELERKPVMKSFT